MQWTEDGGGQIVEVGTLHGCEMEGALTVLPRTSSGRTSPGSVTTLQPGSQKGNMVQAVVHYCERLRVGGLKGHVPAASMAHHPVAQSCQ